MTETDDDKVPNGTSTGGAIADGLTFVRLAITPIIMFVIIKAWSGRPDDPLGFVSLKMDLVILATVLFVVAALTDIADDFIGGSAASNTRMFGWFDDIADSILVAGVLIALLWVSHKVGLLHWTFAVPVAIYIGRDIAISLVKGYEISKSGFFETRLGDIKNVLAMLAVCLLVSAPWLSGFFDRLRAGSDPEKIMKVYDSSSPYVWNTGLVILWIAAILSLLSAVQLFKAKPPQQDEVA